MPWSPLLPFLPVLLLLLLQVPVAARASPLDILPEGTAPCKVWPAGRAGRQGQGPEYGQGRRLVPFPKPRRSYPGSGGDARPVGAKNSLIKSPARWPHSQLSFTSPSQAKTLGCPPHVPARTSRVCIEHLLCTFGVGTGVSSWRSRGSPEKTAHGTRSHQVLPTGCTLARVERGANACPRG